MSIGWWIAQRFRDTQKHSNLDMSLHKTPMESQICLGKQPEWRCSCQDQPPGMKSWYHLFFMKRSEARRWVLRAHSNTSHNNLEFQNLTQAACVILFTFAGCFLHTLLFKIAWFKKPYSCGCATKALPPRHLPKMLEGDCTGGGSCKHSAISKLHLPSMWSLLQ